MANRYILREEENGWYFGPVSYRNLSDGKERALTERERATTFTSKKKAAEQAERLKLSTGFSYLVERV